MECVGGWTGDGGNLDQAARGQILRCENFSSWLIWLEPGTEYAWQYIDTNPWHDSDAGSGEVCCQFGLEQTDHYWSVFATNVPKLITDELL